MQKKIIVPSNFSVESLLTVKSLVENCSANYIYDIKLVHGYLLSSSITDLLFYSKSQILNSLLSEDFKEACEILKNKYDSKINSITTDLFTGESHSAFLNYIDALQFDAYLVPGNYVFHPKSAKSIDLVPFLKKSSLEPLNADWKIIPTNNRQSTIADLLFSIQSQ
jgi:hypothetical protein